MDRVLRHVVMFQFKEGTTENTIRQIERAFAALPEKIEADRDTYLPHPSHQEFVSLVKPRVEKSLVLDYWAR